MATGDTGRPTVLIETVDVALGQDGLDEEGDNVLVPGEEREQALSPPNRRESMLESLRKMGSGAARVTVGENRGKLRWRSTQELRKMLKNKQSPRSSDQGVIKEEDDDEDGSLDSDDFVAMINGKRPWRRFSNGPAKGGDGSMRLRSKSDEGLPLIRSTLHDAENYGVSSRRMRSRRRRKYAQDNNIEIQEEEDDDDDDDDEVEPDIHAGRVRRGSILIPAGLPKVQTRHRRRGGSQDFLIEESLDDDDTDMEKANRRGRSKLLINSVRKNDQETRRRRPRPRRSSMMDKSVSESENKLHPPRGRFLSLPGSSRRSRRGSVSDVEDDDDEDGLGKMGKRGGFLSTGTSHEVAKTSKEDLRKKNRERLLRRFKIYCKLITSFHRLCQAYFLSVNKMTSASDFSGIHGLLEEPEQELLFDVRKFRANKESSISADSRRILSMRPDIRTEKDKYHVLISMRNYPTFCEYPLAMQQEIVGVGWYVSYQAQRIILRQGHWAENFYFILSGSVVISVMDEGTHENRTVVYLNRGETFGELGLVNRAKRQATVIARERIEMITINANDYTRIFMAGGLSTLLNPQQNDNAFVRNLRFLEGWPLHRLAENPKKCVFSYFKRGDILIKDSRRSDWIIIVKSGSCQVMKLLLKDKPKPKGNQTTDNENDDSKQKKRWSNRLDSKNVDGSLIENFEQRKKREEFENFMKDFVDTDGGSATARDAKDPTNDDFDEELKRLASDESDIEGDNVIDQEQRGRSSSSANSESQGDGIDKNIPTKHKAAYLSRKRTKTLEGIPSALLHEEEDNGVEEGVNPIADILFLHNVQQKADKQKSTQGKKKTLLDDIGGSDFDTLVVDENTEPVWVRVQTLIKGSVFGIEDMAYDSQPSFAVISNGAECILMSKKLYKEHATMRMISKLRMQYQRYPPEGELQAGLEVKLKWDNYKTDMLKQTVLESKARDRATKFR